MRLVCFCLLALASVPAGAQLAAPNAAGVSMGHIHLIVPDVAAQTKAWEDVFGARQLVHGILKPLELPGIFIMITKSRKPPTGGTMGSVVNHVGFLVKNYPQIKARALKEHLPVRELTPNRQAFITFPDNVTVEVLQDKGLPTPVAFHHIHLFVSDPEAARAWYDKEFGGRPGTRRKMPASMIPGGQVDFIKAQRSQAPTRGRALDHIGFEVAHLRTFLQKLKHDGVTINIPYRDYTKQVGLKIAFVTDPNGTYIELTEGLNKL